MLKQIDFTKLPITEIVNEIIYNAAKAGVSDMHFDPTETAIRVRFRIDGVLRDYMVIPQNIKKNLIARLKIISGMDITESRLPQDGAIKTTIKDLELDMRVSSLPTNVGEKIVIRILDYSSSSKGLESLGFSPNNLKKMKNLIKEPNGIILVTGATGSGKSTTVYSLLQILNTPEVNLITVEDPVEMGIEGINQIQVNSEIGLTFASVLRSILRQDPDIIMIGEIRDDETAKIAVRASITGHLVLSTLHTNNALNTIERLTDMEVERYLLASSLNGVVSQKLARRICPHCMKKRPAIAYERKLVKANLGIDITELSYGEGCSECVGGYKGRIAIHEVLVLSQEIRDAIANGMAKEELRHLVYKGDTRTLLQDGLEKVVQDKTTIEEILRLVELSDEDVKIINETYQQKDDEALDSLTNTNNQVKIEVKEPINNTIINQSKAEPELTSSPSINQVKQNNEPASIPSIPVKKDEKIDEEIEDLEFISEPIKEEKINISTPKIEDSNLNSSTQNVSKNLEPLKKENENNINKQNIPSKSIEQISNILTNNINMTPPKPVSSVSNSGFKPKPINQNLINNNFRNYIMNKQTNNLN